MNENLELYYVEIPMKCHVGKYVMAINKEDAIQKALYESPIVEDKNDIEIENADDIKEEKIIVSKVDIFD